MKADNGEHPEAHPGSASAKDPIRLVDLTFSAVGQAEHRHILRMCPAPENTAFYLSSYPAHRTELWLRFLFWNERARCKCGVPTLAGAVHGGRRSVLVTDVVERMGMDRVGIHAHR